MRTQPTTRATTPRRNRRAFTLVEMMFSLVIFGLVVAGLLGANLIGLREQQMLNSKCGADDISREVLGQLPEDIRSSKMFLIGNLSGTNFTVITNNSAQNGPALQLFQTTNNSAFIMYYFDLSNATNNDGHLMRYSNSNPTPVCIASNLVNWLTNGFSFVAEDFTGTVITNEGSSSAYKSVIHVKLQFAQFLNTPQKLGTNGLFDYYKMEFRATPHLPE